MRLVSVGLPVVKIENLQMTGNEQLPYKGTVWVRLRSGEIKAMENTEIRDPVYCLKVGYCNLRID